MTTVYFVRHAEPNYKNHDDMTRELTEKGLRDRKLVTQFLSDKNVDAVLSSPFRRARETVQHFADSAGLPVEIVDDFRERRVDSVWIEDFLGFAERQWADFDYKLSDGESMSEVQARNIAALHDVLRRYEGKTVAVGSHGTAMSAILNYYDRGFGYEEFCRWRKLMPWIVQLKFDGGEYRGRQVFNLFEIFAPSVD